MKDQALNSTSEDIKTHQLAAAEINYLKLLNLTLQYHTMGQRIMSGFLYYVATTRLGYPDGVNLQFEIDLQQKEPELTIKLLPQDVAQPEQ